MHLQMTQKKNKKNPILQHPQPNNGEKQEG